MTTKNRANNVYDYQRGGPDANKMVRKSEIIQKTHNDRLDLDQPLSAQLNTSNRRGVGQGNTSANDYYILSQEQEDMME